MEGINKPIIKIQEYAKKRDILLINVLTIKALESRSVLTLSCVSTYGSVHQYL